MHAAWLSLIKTHPDADIISGNRIRFARTEGNDARPALSPLSHLGVIRVEGEEAAAFLHNLTSNDVKKLAPGAVHWNSLSTAKGRLLASFLLWRDDAGYGLILAEELAAEIAKKLSMYVLRAKVKVRDASADFALLGMLGDAGELADLAPARILDLPQDARRILVLPTEQLETVWTALSARMPVAGTSAWILADIAAGWPWITKATQDEFIAQMVNLELLGGVNFQKGCYPGQEIVARTQYLGKLKKRMYRAELVSDEAVLPGQDLYAPAFGEQSCGKLVTVAEAGAGRHAVLAVLQMAAFDEGDVHLGSPGGPRLAFGSLPYAID